MHGCIGPDRSWRGGDSDGVVNGNFLLERKLAVPQSAERSYEYLLPA
ncbi:hypothetical protein [Acidobacterium sp. S8]|nr:hypothetical protein [Acidobacterium sp. S8]